MNYEGTCQFCGRDIGGGHEITCPYYWPKETSMTIARIVAYVLLFLIVLLALGPCGAQAADPAVQAKVALALAQASAARPAKACDCTGLADCTCQAGTCVCTACQIHHNAPAKPAGGLPPEPAWDALLPPGCVWDGAPEWHAVSGRWRRHWVPAARQAPMIQPWAAPQSFAPVRGGARGC